MNLEYQQTSTTYMTPLQLVFFVHLIFSASTAPAPSLCTGDYSCLSPASPDMMLYLGVSSVSRCRSLCASQPRCEFYTYSISTHKDYRDRCILVSKCNVRMEGDGRWISAPLLCRVTYTQYLAAKYQLFSVLLRRLNE